MPAIISLTILLMAASPALSQGEPYALGADISWIPQREAGGTRYRQQGDSQDKDILLILKDNKFNYIRLRLFVDPTAGVPADSAHAREKAQKEGGQPWYGSPYSTGGYCGLQSTIDFAKRVKAAGFKFLLDFHYSDTWADPAKQFKPVSWSGQNINQLVETVRKYTRESLEAFKDADVLPDMVQVGNEVVNGMIHPEGGLYTAGGGSRNFARLVNAGINGVKDVDANILIMMHTISQHNPNWWVGNLRDSLNWVEANAANKIDVIGLSYYPEWHGDLTTLNGYLTAIAANYPYKISVVEYADLHREVNDLVFNLPNNKGFGTFVWEPQEFAGDNSKPLFSSSGTRRTTNALMDLYPIMAKDYGLNTNICPPVRQAHGKNIRGTSVAVRGRMLSVSSPHSNDLQIRMIDTKGKVRARFNTSGSTTFSLTNIPPGRYFAEVKGGGGIRQTLPILVK